MNPRHKRKPPTRTYLLDKYLTGELEGFHVVMGSPDGHQLIRLRSGEMTESEAITFAVSLIVEHDFDVTDLLDLDDWILLAISKAWGEARKDAVLPPTSASS